MTDIPRRRDPHRSRRLKLVVILVTVTTVATAVAAAARTRAAVVRPTAGKSSPTAFAPPSPPRITAPDSARLASAARRGARLPRLRSLLVSWNGNLVLERYYGGAKRETTANIKSASKTIISALIGIAITRGDLRLDQTLGELLPDETRGLEPSKRAITVEDLLTMRAGLQSTSFENYGGWVESRNWVRDALRRPMVSDRGPSGPMIYSTGNSHLLSAILTRATHTSTHAFADRYLFRPLGVRLRGWTTDPQGIYFGGNEMRLTPREMLAFGTLYLRNGVANGGAPVVTRQWIDSSWAARTESRWSGHQYGYGWWIRSTRGYPTYFAWGYGGQFIFVIPQLQLVVVTTSDPEVRSHEGGHIDEICAILDEEIVSAP